MIPVSGPATLIKGGFIRIDPRTNAIVQLLAFQYNPETLSRSLVALPDSGVASEPREGITFTLVVDANDPVQVRDATAAQNGVYPLLSALELLLYVPAGPPASAPLIVFAWGRNRVLPVRMTEFQILEQSFDPTLNPVRVEIAVTLLVLKDADLAVGSFARKLWDDHLILMQELAKEAPAATLADLGLSGVQ